MAPPRKRSRAEQARQFLTGGAVLREDSDDELGYEDHPWEWMREGDGHGGRIVGARMGSFTCALGDTVLLKADGGQAWVGIICDFFDDDNDDGDGDKMARFLWFSSEKEIRNKSTKRTDFLPNELYITAAFDDNPLATINGTARVVSPAVFDKLHPSGHVKKTSKDFGKIFVCRRGCNTRTTTYTPEFAWEDVYRGVADIPALVELVESQTKATRRRGAPAKRDARDLDDFVAGDSGDDDDVHDAAPRTPRKRRKLAAAATPTSARSRAPKFLTPSHRRIVVKKALEFTPLGTRVLSPAAISSPFQVARNQLHVSSVPAALPCREEEYSTVYSHLEAAITEGAGSCIYISGTPGTGKTATVREVVAQLHAAVQAEELDDFIFVEINGMKVTDPHQSYSLLWQALRGARVSPSHALELLEREFSTPSPRRVPCVVLMDELDQLVTKNQSVMYNFFNWPGLRHSRLIVLAVANTMDLPERTLSNKISSRLGLTRITFPGYTHTQLMQIIQSRLQGVPGDIVQPDAIQFAARKVAAVSGDARRALDICRRAVELAESEAAAHDANTAAQSQPDTPSRKGRGRPEGTASSAVAKVSKKGRVTIPTIKMAINEATSSPLQLALRALPLVSKVFLAALLARTRSTGLGEAILGDVVDEVARLSTMSQEKPIHSYILSAPAVSPSDPLNPHTPFPNADSDALPRGRAPSSSTAPSTMPRPLGVGSAVAELADAGIVGVERSYGGRVGRVRLRVGEEEVRLALGDDMGVRGMGVAA